MRFLGEIWAWRTARGGSDGKNGVFKTPLHGLFINGYVRKDFGGDSFGRATPAFRREKRAPRDDFFAIFFGILSLLAKTKALLVETIALSVEILSLLVCPMSLLIFPMSLLVSRKRAIGKNEGGDGEKNDGSSRVFRLKAGLGRMAPRFLLFSFCQNILHFEKNMQRQLRRSARRKTEGGPAENQCDCSRMRRSHLRMPKKAIII